LLFERWFLIKWRWKWGRPLDFGRLVMSDEGLVKVEDAIVRLSRCRAHVRSDVIKLRTLIIVIAIY
jgi:hypothetical protein